MVDPDTVSSILGNLWSYLEKLKILAARSEESLAAGDRPLIHVWRVGHRQIGRTQVGEIALRVV